MIKQNNHGNGKQQNKNHTRYAERKEGNSMIKVCIIVIEAWGKRLKKTLFSC